VASQLWVAHRLQDKKALSPPDWVLTATLERWLVSPPDDGPYADLRGRFEARRLAYLTMPNSDGVEFRSDPLKYCAAGPRGYHRSSHSGATAPKPFFSFADQDAAGDAAGKHLTLWTEDPRLLASSDEPWDVEFLEHPDALHCEFLGAGAARVIIAIQPGYEEQVSLLDQGQSGKLTPQSRFSSVIADIVSANAKFATAIDADVAGPGIPWRWAKG